MDVVSYKMIESDMRCDNVTLADVWREYADIAGAENPEKPWILNDWDVWMPNPHFKGDRGPHPED